MNFCLYTIPLSANGIKGVVVVVIMAVVVGSGGGGGGVGSSIGAEDEGQGPGIGLLFISFAFFAIKKCVTNGPTNRRIDQPTDGQTLF